MPEAVGSQQHHWSLLSSSSRFELPFAAEFTEVNRGSVIAKNGRSEPRPYSSMKIASFSLFLRRRFSSGCWKTGQNLSSESVNSRDCWFGGADASPTAGRPPLQKMLLLHRTAIFELSEDGRLTPFQKPSPPP